MVEKTDYCQLTKLAVKDDGAFIELYQAFFRRVYNFVYANTKNAMDADELTNDIFYAVFKNLDKYNDDFYFSTWLFTIVRHMIIDFHRKKNKKKQVVAEDWEEFLTESASESGEPEVQLLIKEERRALLNAIEKLKEREREVIELKYFADCSNVEIAEILNLTPSNVGIILFRALKKLKEFL